MVLRCGPSRFLLLCGRRSPAPCGVQRFSLSFSFVPCSLRAAWLTTVARREGNYKLQEGVWCFSAGISHEPPLIQMPEIVVADTTAVFFELRTAAIGHKKIHIYILLIGAGFRLSVPTFLTSLSFEVAGTMHITSCLLFCKGTLWPLSTTSIWGPCRGDEKKEQW